MLQNASNDLLDIHGNIVFISPIQCYEIKLNSVKPRQYVKSPYLQIILNCPMHSCVLIRQTEPVWIKLQPDRNTM